MDSDRASHQDIRPIKILILNLMPQKIVTETQLLRLLANTPLQLEVEFLYMASHESKNTHSDHLKQFYKTFEQVRDSYFDGLIVTGAPVENLPLRKLITGKNLLKFLIGQKHMFIQHCTFVGVHRQVCMHAMVYPNTVCLENYQGYIVKK